MEKLKFKQWSHKRYTPGTKGSKQTRIDSQLSAQAKKLGVNGLEDLIRQSSEDSAVRLCAAAKLQEIDKGNPVALEALECLRKKRDTLQDRIFATEAMMYM